MEATLEELQRQYDEYKVCQCNCFSRVVGYYRPVAAWNDGKQEEHKQRLNFKLLGE